MNRLLLVLLAVHGSYAATADARDYLLRVDTVGYPDTPKSDRAPEDALLCRMETIARPGTVFHSKVRIGMQTCVLHGEFHPNDDGTYLVTIRYADITDTGATVPRDGGGVKPVVDESSAFTTMSVSLGVPVLLGGMQTEKTDVTETGEKTTLSKTNYVLTLTKYSNPRADTE